MYKETGSVSSSLGSFAAGKHLFPLFDLYFICSVNYPIPPTSDPTMLCIASVIHSKQVQSGQIEQIN